MSLPPWAYTHQFEVVELTKRSREIDLRALNATCVVLGHGSSHYLKCRIALRRLVGRVVLKDGCANGLASDGSKDEGGSEHSVTHI